MQYFKNLFRRAIRSLPVILLTSLAIYIYLSHISPYSSSGALDILHLVVITILAGILSFFIYHILNSSIPKSFLNALAFALILVLRAYHVLPIWLAITVYILVSIVLMMPKKKPAADSQNIEIEFGQTSKDNV